MNELGRDDMCCYMCVRCAWVLLVGRRPDCGSDRIYI